MSDFSKKLTLSLAAVVALILMGAYQNCSSNDSGVPPAYENGNDGGGSSFDTGDNGNGDGSSNNNFTPVKITTQLSNSTKVEGESITLFVGASGDIKNYVWQKDGAFVAEGQSANTLPLNNLQKSDGGVYSVDVVGMDNGKAFSSMVLTVEDQPEAEEPPPEDTGPACSYIQERKLVTGGCRTEAPKLGQECSPSQEGDISLNPTQDSACKNAICTCTR
jgi:hypothetical protein